MYKHIFTSPVRLTTWALTEQLLKEKDGEMKMLLRLLTVPPPPRMPKRDSPLQAAAGALCISAARPPRQQPR